MPAQFRVKPKRIQSLEEASCLLLWDGLHIHLDGLLGMQIDESSMNGARDTASVVTTLKNRMLRDGI